MNIRKILQNCGPGMVVAATGLGAGDIVAAAVAGAEFGTTLLWAVVVGALLKFCLNEGIGRWQLCTGTTLLEGWIRHLPKFISWYFMAYLLLWSFMVAAAMMAATGLAAYALWPIFSVTTWGILHAVVTFVIVLTGAWRLLEVLMKAFMVIMFATILICAALVLPNTPGLIEGMLHPGIPDGSLTSLLSVMGGVGGSVTLMSYGYWMQEAGWKSTERVQTMRWDLAVAYTLTAIFAMAIVILAAGIKPEVIAGNNMAVAVAEQLVPYTGNIGKWLFLFGFWGAVASSMLGVWHGVPYLFANFIIHYRNKTTVIASEQSITRSNTYRWYLAAMCFLPMTLLVLGRPVWIVVVYAVTGAFFMPLLAGLLLWMNSKRRWLGAWGNGKAVWLCLWLCLLLFGYLLFTNPSA
jgi:Mn2+/Fe2+ NRAMP family transporter